MLSDRGRDPEGPVRFMTTETFTLAHISDLHLSPISGLTVRHWTAKRGLGYINWHRGRVRHHLRSIADKIAADALAARPDHIAVTGDLANLGLPAEFEAARRWLEALGSPEYVTVVPGNHDIYSTRMHGHSCLKDWADYMVPLGASRGAQPVFPFVRRFGHVALVGLNSAVPTPPFVASGRLGRQQIDAFQVELRTLSNEGFARVVLIHHPPLPGQAPLLRGLEDAAAFARVIDAEGAELVLHGHDHVDSLIWQTRSGGHVPVVGVASGSSGRVHPREPLARYNLYTFTREAGALTIRCVTRGLDRPDGEIVELSRTTLART